VRDFVDMMEYALVATRGGDPHPKLSSELVFDIEERSYYRRIALE
jgi:hypothetical protein